jgi:integrase
VERGELRDLSRVSFGDYAREWIVNYQGRTSNGFRESTRRAYALVLQTRIIPYFDSRVRLRLAELEPRDVKAFVRWMNEQEDPRRPGRLLGKSWIRQHIAVLRALLGDAMEEGVIRHNPAAGVRVTVPEGDGTARPRAIEKRAMTIDELRRVVAEVPPRWQLLFEFMAHTGLRIGEVSELRWGRDVILTGRPYVKLRDNRVCEPKTRYGKRDIPLSPGLVRKLTAIQPADSDGKLVFVSTREHASTATTCRRRSSRQPRAKRPCRGSRCTPSATPAPRYSSRPSSTVAEARTPSRSRNGWATTRLPTR